jgi:antitoxin FitA
MWEQCLHFEEKCINMKKNKRRCIMPSIQVRDLPEQIYNKIKNNAQKDHRSLSQQAIVTLKKGLGIDEDHKERRRILVDQIMSRQVVFDIAKLGNPVHLIREDRDR